MNTIFVLWETGAASSYKFWDDKTAYESFEKLKESKAISAAILFSQLSGVAGVFGNLITSITLDRQGNEGLGNKYSQ